MGETLLVSACFAGINCKYNGGNNLLPEDIWRELGRVFSVRLVCPECMGELPVPREPCERRGERVICRDGRDLTEAFERGAQAALDIAERNGCRLALLKENSPSCGCGTVYDGSFTGKLVPGDGVTAELLKRHGVTVYGESRIKELLDAAYTLAENENAQET